MYRKQLQEMLSDHPMTVSEISRELDVTVSEVASDLQHLSRSLRHESAVLQVEPAHCRKCGFVFHRDKLTKPGKCPRCKGTWIEEPRICVSRSR